MTEFSSSGPEGVEDIRLAPFDLLGHALAFKQRAERLVTFMDTEILLHQRFLGITAVLTARQKPVITHKLPEALAALGTLPNSFSEQIVYPAIRHMPDSSDAAQDRIIVLEERAVTLKHGINGTPICNTPSLNVYTIEDFQRAFVDEAVDYPADLAEHAFMRDELELMAGFEDGYGFAQFAETVFKDPEGLATMEQNQESYGLWLGHAATAVGLSPYTAQAVNPPYEPGAN